MKKELEKKSIWGVGVLCVALLGLVVLRDMVPTGSLQVSTDFRTASPFFSVLMPEERTEITDSVVLMNGEPLYIDSKIPRYFDTATATLTYSAPDDMSVGLGIDVGTAERFAFDIRQLSHPLIDSLDWEFIEEEGMRLYQKDPEYSSIGVFKNFFDDFSVIGSVNLESSLIPTVPKDTAQEEFNYLFAPLRGSYTLVTPVGDDPLSLTFSFDDAPFTIILRNSKGEAVYETQTESVLNLADLLQDIYTIEVNRPDDAITSEIKTLQEKLVFKNKVVFADSEAISQNLTVTGDAFRLIAKSAQGIQTIEIGAEALSLAQPLTVYEIDRYLYNEEVALIPSGLELSGKGYIALTSDQYFQPGPLPIVSHVPDSVNYILTPAETNTNTVSFDLNAAHIADGKIRYVISAPDVSEENPIELYRLDITYTGDRLSLSSLPEFTKNYLKYAYIQFIRN